MKKIFLLATLLFCSYFTWNHFKKPNFVNTPNGGIRSAAWDWDHAENNREKIDAANEINLMHPLRTQPLSNEVKAEKTLVEEEEKSFQEALAFLENLRNKIREFELSLKQEDIIEITQDHPDSLPRLTNRFSYFKDDYCNKSDYAKLKAQYPLRELGSRAIRVMAYTYTSEFINRKDYNKRLMLPMAD